MRITDSMRVDAMMLTQSRVAERMQRATAVASSGARVSAPSDDPAAFARITARDGRIGVLSGRSSAAQAGASDLDAAESALAAASDALTQAKSIALQAANGTLDATTRADMAVQIDPIRSQLVALGNTRGASGYVFGGTKTDTPPFDATGAFSGNDTATHLEVADGVTVRSNASGARAFTAAGGTDIFAGLAALKTALQANDGAGIQTAIRQLDDGQRQIIAARTDAGLSAERLRSASDVIDTALTTEKTARAADADADAPSAYSELAAAQTAYERSLAVTKQILSLPSLASV